MSASAGRPTRREDRWNAALTVVLALAAVVLANRIARAHLVVRRDLSQDRLYAISDATRDILDQLDDTLQVKTLFTGAIESGEVALVKARVEAQLAELAALAGRRMDLVALDPASSSEAAAEVRRLQIYPRRVQFQQGTQVVEQEVYLGLLLRYRGREQVLAWVDPWSFEVQFSSAVYSLVRDRRAQVAWLGPWREDPARPGGPSYESARRLIATRHDLVPDEQVAGLRYGEPVPEDVEVLIAVAPLDEHPRVAFELDQFVQRGGKLVVLVDRVQYDVFRLESTRAFDPDQPPETGLEDLLALWGALPTPEHVWDTAWKTQHEWLRPRRVPGQADQPPQFDRVPCTTPLLVTPAAEGIDAEHPITAGLNGVTFSWCHPLPDRLPVPDGVERSVLFRASPDAFRTPLQRRHVVTQEDITGHSAMLLATVPPDRRGGYALAVALSGRFPSPFSAAPTPDDPLLAGEAVGTTDEAVLSGAASTQVVVFGDADWLRDDPRGFGLFPFQNAPGNTLLFLNLLDWLTLDEQLIALRRRLPRERPLFDFEGEARRDAGLDYAEPPSTPEGFRDRLRREEEARAAARSARWRRMVLPVGATLALVLGFGLAWNLAQRRARGRR